MHDRIEVALEGWGRFIVRRRWLVVAVTLAFTAALGSRVPQMTIDNSTEALLRKDDPERVRYDDFRARFDRDDGIFLILRPPEIFDFDFLAKLKRFHEDLERGLPYVSEVTSLVNARHTYGAEDELVVEDFLETWPETEGDLAELRRRALSNPFFEENLLSRSLEYTAVSIKPFTYSTLSSTGQELEGFDDSEADGGDEGAGQAGFLTAGEGQELVRALRRIVARHEGPDLAIHMVGGPVMDERFADTMNRDVTTFQSWALVIVAALLYALFRRLSGVVLPVLVVNASLLASLGAMVALGIPFSVTLQIVPAFLMVVGVCDAIHILVIVYQRMAGGAPKEEAIPFAIRHSGVAVIMTSVTTAAGLMSFVFAQIATVAQLGVVGPIGIMLAMVYSLTLLPALLAVIPLKPLDAKDVGARHGWTDRFLAWCGRVSTTHPKLILTVAAAILVIGSNGALSIRLSHNGIKWFPEEDPIRVAATLVDREFGGAGDVEILIDTGRENGLHDPDTLTRIERAMRYVEGLSVDGKAVGRAFSIIDILKETHQALNENRREYYAIPDDRRLVAQELLLFENSGSDDVEEVTDGALRTARVRIRLPWVDAVKLPVFLDEMQEGLAEILGEGSSFEITGGAPLFTRIFNSVLVSLVRSYVFALAVITPMLVLLVGNVRRGLAAMIPNLLPLVMVLGLMGWADIPLDMSTLLIGGIVIGLAVDDTIHFMHKFNRYYESTGDPAAAVRETLATTGSALLFTSLVLGLGFAAFMFAYMINIFWFGLLVVFAITIAFLADVLVGPALMIVLTKAGIPDRR